MDDRFRRALVLLSQVTDSPEQHVDLVEQAAATGKVEQLLSGMTGLAHVLLVGQAEDRTGGDTGRVLQDLAIMIEGRDADDNRSN